MLFKIPPKMANRSLMMRYLEVDLWAWFRELTVGLLKLNFRENFETFSVENLTIAAGQEVAIPNGFKGRSPGLIPSGRIITRQTIDNTVVDGPSAWTQDIVFLKNVGAADVKISVIFFK